MADRYAIEFALKGTDPDDGTWTRANIGPFSDEWEAREECKAIEVDSDGTLVTRIAKVPGALAVE